MHKRPLLLFVLIALLLAACGSSPQEDFAQRLGQARKAPANDTASSMFLSNVRRVALAATATDTVSITPDQLFDWAEATYPQLFPTHEKTLEWSVYQYRYYKDTDVYLGVDSDQRVVALGAPTGGMLVDLGPLASYASSVNAAATPIGPNPELQGFGRVSIPVRPSQFSALWSCPPFTDWGLPSLNVDLLCKTGIAIGHDPDTKGPRWVIEQLTPAKIQGDAQRKDNFRTDPDLARGRRAELSDYAASGYDRGHMAAAANMAWSQTAMDESFLLSNILPQNPSLNRSAWARLEDDVRRWVIGRDTLWVITGPVFRGNRSIGAGVRVPDALFKVLFDPKREEAFVLVVPNESVVRYNEQQHFVTLSELERQTGLKLLSRKPS